MAIGERIKELRNNRGMTQGKLAQEVGVDQVYMSRVENGHVKNVRPKVVQKLAQIFGVSIEYLLVGEELEAWYRPTSEERIQRFLRVFTQLSPENQALLMDFADMLMKRSKWERDNPMQKEKQEPAPE